MGFKNCDFVEVISRCSRLIGTRWLYLLLCLVKRSEKLTLYFGFCPIISIFRRNRQVLQKFANIASLGLKIADFRRLAIYRQAQILIASSMSKIADLAIYRQKWQHCCFLHEININNRNLEEKKHKTSYNKISNVKTNFWI